MMGNTNPEGEDVRRRMLARDIISSKLTNTSTLDKTKRTELALSGRTTTARGYVIVPPTKAKLIAFEYEEAPERDISDDNIQSHSDGNIDAEKYNSSVTVMMNKAGRSSIPSLGERVVAESQSLKVRRNAVTRNAFDISKTDYPDQSVGLRRNNSPNKTMHADADTSAATREQRSDRNQSVSPASTLGAVTGSNSEVSSSIAALREEYAVKKQNQADSHNALNLNRTQRGIATSGDDSQGKSTCRRRRGRPSAQSNEQLAPSAKQSISVRKTVTNFNALGNTNPRRKYSPYPAYIQPVIEENTSYRGPSNHMPYHGSQSSSYAAQRSRKISTEMNRYESSPSSSSSSESDHESPKRPPVKKTIDRVIQAKNLIPDTPETSDAEKQKPGLRRRRVRRRGVPVSSKDPSDSYLLAKPSGESSGKQRNVPRVHGVRRRPKNVIPLLDDKYVSLPDNYKPSEFQATMNSTNDGGVARVVGETNSQGDLREKHSNVASKLTHSREHEVERDDTHSLCVIRDKSNVGISAGLRRASDFPSSANANQLIISDKENLNHRRALSSSTSHDISQNKERLLSGTNVSAQADLANSSPELHEPNRRALHSSRNPSERHQYGAKGRRSNFGEELKHAGAVSSKFEDGSEISKASEIAKPSEETFLKNRTGRGGLRNVYQDASAVVQRQSRPTVRKISEYSWPPDENTKQLSSHTTPRNTKTLPASVTMQETIDQLNNLANQETPIKSRSNSMTTLSDDYSRNQESDKVAVETPSQDDSKSTWKGSSSRFVGASLSRVQMVKTSPVDVPSPCMSSTETLKECGSSGEHQDKNSRSPSIDSTASNPETISHNVGGTKERSQRAKVLYAGRSTLINDELFIEEKNRERGQSLHAFKEQLGTQKSNSSGDLSASSSNKTMVEQFNSLTDALKKFMRPQTLPTTPLEKATLRQDTVMTVSPKGNVTCQPPKLETVTEHPDSSEVDEGIVTELEYNQDPKSYLKLYEHLEESNRRNKRTPSQKDPDSNGNESARSLSDPSADRKRSQTGTVSVDSNLLSALGKKEDIGSFEHTSLSSSGQFSENPSSYSDTLNIDELINEEKESEENRKGQTKLAKKKSKSDPNPEGFVNIDGQEVIIEPEKTVVQAASSEPNVIEQTDQLGDLDQFQNYQNTKGLMLMHDKGPMKPHYVEEQIFTVSDNSNKHAHVSPRNIRQPTMKSRIRQQNGGNSIMSQLIADNAACMPTSHSSTSSPLASEESSPVQKQGPDGLLESEAEEQFFNLYDSMTSKNSLEEGEQRSHPPVVHSRSSSEPVPINQVLLSERTSSEPYQEPYGARGRRPGLIKPPSLGSVDDIPNEAPVIQHSLSVDPVFSPPKEGYRFSPAQDKGKAGHDMRLHAFKNLRDTEESYLSSLRILYQDYMTPLKHPEHHSTCEPRLVDEMFYKIPQLYQHHEKFYENVQKCYEEWDYKDVQLGDLFLNSFNENALLETYTAYITNYLNAREAVRTAEEKEPFKRFIEQCRAENKDKQGLADLMIKPVQRIPRYELVIKDMLKHTPSDHPDRKGLLIAQKEIHKLAVQMNKSEKEAEFAEKQDRLLADLEQLIEGLVDLSVPKRRFLRQDIVTEMKGQTKKDRCIWLFSDLIVCSTRKGRTGTFRRGSMWNLNNMGQDRFPSVDFGYKYKFLWKFPLEDVNTENNSIAGRHAADKQLQSLQADMEILSNIQKQASQIECNHVQLDEALREIIIYVNRQTFERRLSFQPVGTSGRVELSISTGEGTKNFLFEFQSDDHKVQFEKLFSNAKRNLTTFKNRWEPTFAKAIPISTTRSGMQFSCAASNVDASPDVKEVWVCNTDGYVGQVCFLTLEPEPNQTQCITVCHAKINCIAQVPAWERRLVPAQAIIQEVVKAPVSQHPATKVPESAAVHIIAWDEDEDSDEDNTSPQSTPSSQSSSVNQSPYGTFNGENLAAADIASLPGLGGSQGAAWSRNPDGSTLHGSLEDLLQGNVVGDAQTILAGKDSMWLGTDDGKIHIYPSSQSTRGSKHCVQVRHSAAVQCILYHEGRVFVALNNGDLVVYTRNMTTGEWDFEKGKTKARISSPYAIMKMVVVLERKELWCGCQNLIKIINIDDLTNPEVPTTDISVGNDSKRQIHCMVNCGYGVWVSLDKKPQIKLYHTVTHDLLADIDVSNTVNKMLASADAIIKQHKAACLRITALLVSNDLLWVGTSAGVVLTLALPKIALHTNALAMPVIPRGLAYGHTGQVRSLACAQLAEKELHSLSRGSSRRASANGGKRRSSSSSNSSNQTRTVSVIISGGDGYEDFRMNSNSESAGRDDSTNHLLVWRA